MFTSVATASSHATSPPGEGRSVDWIVTAATAMPDVVTSSLAGERVSYIAQIRHNILFFFHALFQNAMGALKKMLVFALIAGVLRFFLKTIESK